MIAYDTSHVPPAPVLQVTVVHVFYKRRRRSLPALVDTGSDITAIPWRIADELQLYPIGRLKLEDLDAQNQPVLTYAVQLTLTGLLIPRLEVVLTGLDFAVLGRDVLNRFYVLLNGPELNFEISAEPVD